MADERRLAWIDRETWSWEVAPVPLWPETANFFRGEPPDDVIVADEADGPVGYVKLRHPTQLESNRHVLQVGGLAVDPAWQRRGIARLLIEAAVCEASRRKARRLTLRVLGHNEAARALYLCCGFEVEGILRDEFWLNGRYVDDVLMARGLL